MIEPFMESTVHIAILFVILALAVVGIGIWLFIVDILSACADEHEEFNRDSDYEGRH